MLIARYRNAEIWLIGFDYLVYGRTADPYICQSLALAREVAGSCAPHTIERSI